MRSAPGTRSRCARLSRPSGRHTAWHPQPRELEPQTCSSWSTWATWPTARRASSHAGRSSVWVWPGRWSTTPASCCSDEPASGLDPRSRIELRDTLRGLAASGATLLVSSHILTELQEIADRAVIVARGRSVAVQDLRAGSVSADGSAHQVSQWRITSLDPPRLMAALAHHGVATQPLTDAVDVEVAGDVAASQLLAQLVGDGIPITAFAPSYGELETAYLAATEDRH